MIQKFDKSNLPTIRADLSKILNAYAAEHGITISIGNIKFSEGEFTAKVEAKIPGVKTLDDTILESVMNARNLQKNGPDGRVLKEYSTRSSKYPFIFTHQGKSYKCSEQQAKLYFSK